MAKTFLFFSIIFLFSCSPVQFDRPMPLQGNKLESLQDLSGTYSFSDTIIKIKDRTFHNANYYKDAYKIHDSITIISGIIYFENQQMGSKIHLKTYYNISKVDTARVIATHKSGKKSIEKNYLIFEDDASDVLIDLAKGDQLKLFESNYYVSKHQNENEWEIYQISVQEDIIYIGGMNDKDRSELSKHAISSTPKNTTVHLNDEDFSTFIKNGGFRTRIKFKKHGTSH